MSGFATGAAEPFWPKQGGWLALVTGQRMRMRTWLKVLIFLEFLRKL